MIGFPPITSRDVLTQSAYSVIDGDGLALNNSRRRVVRAAVLAEVMVRLERSA